MNNLEELLKEVNEEILEQECVQEFFRLKKAIEQDKEIKELDESVRFHQRKMCENQNNDELYFKEKALYEECLQKLESNPIYSNFMEVKKEVNALLLDIRDFLS